MRAVGQLEHLKVLKVVSAAKSDRVCCAHAILEISEESARLTPGEATRFAFRLFLCPCWAGATPWNGVFKNAQLAGRTSLLTLQLSNWPWATQMITEVSDAELVQRAKAGNLAAFEVLATRHEKRVYSLAMRIVRQEQDAEDVTQQAFLSVVENLAKFREESSFATWLYRIATFTALKVLRKRKGLETVSLEEATEPREDYDSVPHPEYIADWRQSPEQLVERNETKRLLDDALAKLDEKHRLVFLLRDVEGLSVIETAGVLGLSESNVKMRLLRARLQLREQLTRVLGDPATRLLRSPHHQNCAKCPP